MYGTILSFFGVLISLFLMDQRSVYGYLYFFPLVTSAFYCYFFRGHLEKSDIIKLFETFQILSNSENLQVFEKLGSNRLAAIIFLGGTFVILTLYPIYLILLALFR
ncbi:hypothetical protein EHQ55_18475 [Leptospira meyeri]|uniref:hypothetical protein n=1 Tax=Leptospira meyeri TaxID=29508 RepID=UPI001083521B|nr:hypothetical protein [Leptospira meyeri]TGL44022.1 hypothetical protein EHQ55_18475 [Leptospira meyeri]